MPTPRLRGGFLELDPARIPEKRLSEAASLSKCGRWARKVPVERLPRMDLVVVGSVAVTLRGWRCGKGHGYGDLEFAVLRELGHPPPPVATTVHPLQVVDAFPRDPHDLPVSLIVTPEEVVEVAHPPPPPGGIDWRLLDAEDLAAMPVLARLAKIRRRLLRT
jgi:5-formyltetrahydrofolate cyclo-ligase